MDLDFIRIEYECSTETAVPLTAALYDCLRNFETYFRATCCTNQNGPCSSCQAYQGCPYLSVFGQELSLDPTVVRLHQKPALPFSMYVRENTDTAKAHCVGMVVIGSAVNYFELFHAALCKAVEVSIIMQPIPVRFYLRLFSLDYNGVRHEITPVTSLPESMILLSGHHILHNTIHSDSIKLLLKSPLRLLSNGSISHQFDFATFFRSQLRRCSSLCAYYGSTELELDFVRLSEQAENVAVFDEKIQYTRPFWSKGQNKSGLTGSVGCTGLVEQMLPVLLLGSYFNAGKGASFGSGFHQIEVL